LTTDEFEQQTNAALVEAGQAAMSSKAGMALREFYDNLPEDQKYTLSHIIAPTANVMTAGFGAGGTQTAGNAAKTALKSTIKEAPKRTAMEAAEAVVKSANPGMVAENNVFQSLKTKLGGREI